MLPESYENVRSKVAYNIQMKPSTWCQ